MSIKDIPAQAPLGQAFDATRSEKPSFPKALNLPPEEEADRVDIGSAAAGETEKESETNWRDVVSGALLLTGTLAGSLAGVPGMATFQAKQIDPPAIVRVIEEAQPAESQVAGTTQQQGAPVHIISHIDASEHIIEPFAMQDMQQLEKMKSGQLDKVDIDAMIVRDTGNPYAKLGTGGAEGLVILAPSIAGWAISRKKKGAAALLIMGIGGALSYTLASGGLAKEVMRNVASGVADLSSGEPVWNGTRVYQVKPDSGGAIDSKLVSSTDALKPSADRVIEFIASQMKAYPRGTTVVHIVGHGLGYHASSGFSFDDYKKIIGEATKQAGRPIDLLVVESCLEGNMEAMMGTIPGARYVIVSEESIPAMVLPDLMGQAMKEQNNENAPVDARALGESIVRNARGRTGVSTLALVDMEKLPGLSGSVDKLGTLLAQEVKDGRVAGIQDAIEHTTTFPASSVEGDMGQKLGMGDLKQFAENILKVYGDTSTGKAAVNQESAASPRATEIKEAATQILQHLKETVPELSTGSGYEGTGGLSIQLPTASMEKLDTLLAKQKMTTFKASDAPQGWKDFVTVTSPKLMPAPTK